MRACSLMPEDLGTAGDEQFPIAEHCVAAAEHVAIRRSDGFIVRAAQHA
jgi:hypothetical protein